MLPLRESFIFPKIKNKKYPGRGEVICELDWSEKDQYDAEKSHHIILPTPYSDWVDQLEFSISDRYRDEIERCSSMMVDEWSIERSFDTCIREAC